MNRHLEPDESPNIGLVEIMLAFLGLIIGGGAVVFVGIGYLLMLALGR